VVQLDLRSPVLGCGAAAPSGASVGKNGAPSVLTVVGKGAGKFDVATYGELEDVCGVLPSLIDDSASGGGVRLGKRGAWLMQLTCTPRALVRRIY
jgi:hypothetical protein